MKKSILTKAAAIMMALAMMVALVPATTVETAAKTTYYYGVYTADVTYKQLYGNSNFDSITTATTGKASRFTNSVSTVDETAGTTTITGVKNVPVRMTSTTWNKNVNDIQSKVTLNEAKTTATSWYLNITSKGKLDGKGMTVKKYTKETVDMTIEAPSTWGSYCIMMTEATPKYLSVAKGVTAPEGYTSAISSDNIIGGTITAKEGKKTKTYTLGTLENLWFQNYEVSFRINKSATMAHMPESTNCKQFSGIDGADITYVTYITTDGVYRFYPSKTSEKHFNLQIPAKYGVTTDGATIATTTTNNFGVETTSTNATATLAVNLPKGFAIDSVTQGRSTVAYQYNHKTGVLTIPNPTAGDYTVQFYDTNGKYVDYKLTVTAK